MDIEGYSQVINLISKNVVSHFNFKYFLKIILFYKIFTLIIQIFLYFINKFQREPLVSLKFSPDGHFLACCTKNSVKIYVSPGV